MTAALAVASGGALAPVLASATPASARPSCAGTSLVRSALGLSVRVPTTANGTRDVSCSLGVGNVGVAVSRLQIGLDHCLNAFAVKPAVAVDGVYGSKTRHAVSQVQHFYHIPQDGIYGPMTAHHMLWPIPNTNYQSCSQIASSPPVILGPSR